MSDRPKILAFAGSLRAGSYNKKLAKIAAESAQQAGAEVSYIDLIDYQLPIYNAEIEETEGLPENALKLKKLFHEHNGFLISAPEYNSSITGVLKNTIDWVSRPATKDEVYLGDFAGKTALLLSTSPGELGGLRGLVHLRSILGNIGVLVLPGQKSIPRAMEAFDERGRIKNAKDAEAVMTLTKGLVDTLVKLLPTAQAINK